MAREVMLVGSAPLKPAMSVYKCACDHGLKSLMRRIPDGEQAGWIGPLLALWLEHPALEPSGEPLAITRRPSGMPLFNSCIPVSTLKPGHSAEELWVEELGIARSLQASYDDFKQAKAAGVVAPETRFVATVPGPAGATMTIDIPPAQLFPVVSRMYREEIGRLVEMVPADELAIQIDLAGEVEGEEYRRRPEAWDSPHTERLYRNWPFEETAALIAEISDAVPEPVELGYHLCAIYHVDESQGQDLNVHVDWANALARGVKRPIDFIHMPTTPDYDVADFEPLRRLTLNPRTKLFLGLIHAEDGVEGATRRMRAAAQVRSDFGIASLCGLNVITRALASNPVPIDEVMELHRQVAEAG